MDAALTVTPSSSGDRASPHAPLEHIELNVGGMTCPHCPPAVENALKAVKGVAEAHVNLATGRAAIDYGPASAKVTDLL